jgi:hypothetical protein
VRSLAIFGIIAVVAGVGGYLLMGSATLKPIGGWLSRDGEPNPAEVDEAAAARASVVERYLAAESARGHDAAAHQALVSSLAPLEDALADVDGVSAEGSYLATVGTVVPDERAPRYALALNLRGGGLPFGRRVESVQVYREGELVQTLRDSDEAAKFGFEALASASLLDVNGDGFSDAVVAGNRHDRLQGEGASSRTFLFNPSARAFEETAQEFSLPEDVDALRRLAEAKVPALGWYRYVADGSDLEVFARKRLGPEGDAVGRTGYFFQGQQLVRIHELPNLGYEGSPEGGPIVPVRIAVSGRPALVVGPELYDDERFYVYRFGADPAYTVTVKGLAETIQYTSGTKDRLRAVEIYIDGQLAQTLEVPDSVSSYSANVCPESRCLGFVHDVSGDGYPALALAVPVNEMVLSPETGRYEDAYASDVAFILYYVFDSAARQFATEPYDAVSRGAVDARRAWSLYEARLGTLGRAMPFGWSSVWVEPGDGAQFVALYRRPVEDELAKGQLLVYRDGVLLQTLTNPERGDDERLEDMPAEYGDANGDGYTDIWVASVMPGSGPASYRVWLYDPAARRYAEPSIQK